MATVNQSEPSATKIRVLAERNVVLIQTPEPVVLEPISAKTLPDAEITSTVGGTLRLVSPWKTIQVNGKALTPDKQGIVSVKTTAGEALTFNN